MNIDDFKNELKTLDDEIDKEVSIADLKLSAIVNENFAYLESIKEKHNRIVKKGNAVKSCYSKKIQDILTKGGKFQKDGSPISEYQILNEMYRVRKLKGLIESPTPTIDNETSFKAPTTDFHSSGVVKVSPKNNKKVVAPINLEVEPIAATNFMAERERIKKDILNFQEKGIPLVWNPEDEFLYQECKTLAYHNTCRIPELLSKGLLIPKFNTAKEEYFSMWCNKAEHFNKLY